MDSRVWTRPALGAARLGSHALRAGLVSALPLQERGGLAITDLADRSRDGTVTGAVSGVVTPWGYGVDFASTSHKITLGTRPMPRDSGTVAFMFRPTWRTGDYSDSANNRGIFNAGDGSANFFYCAKSGGNDKFYAGWYVSGVDYRHILELADYNFQANVWIHIAITYTCPGVTNLWIDGKKITSSNSGADTTSPAAGWNTTGYSMYLGNWWNGTSGSAGGTISGFAIWDRCLSIQQILIHAYDPFCMYRASRRLFPLARKPLAQCSRPYLRSPKPLAQASRPYLRSPPLIRAGSLALLLRRQALPLSRAWRYRASATPSASNPAQPDPWQSQWSVGDADPFRSQWSAEIVDPFRSQWSAE